MTVEDVKEVTEVAKERLKENGDVYSEHILAYVSYLEKQIERMKCCSNCSNLNRGNCKFSLRIKDDVTPFVKIHEDCFCINYDKWELAE